MGFLTGYVDSLLEIEEGVTREALESAEISRIQLDAAVLIVAGQIPRRLGGEASSDDLAADKRRVRRCLHVYKQCLGEWTHGNAPKEWQPVTDEIRIAAAQLVWEVWREDKLSYISQRIRYCATWATRYGESAWGKWAVVRLNNEYGWVEYALRD